MRVEVVHGVNLDQLGRRNATHYGGLSLEQLELRIETWGSELGLQTGFFQTNHEGAYVERLHALRGNVDGLILNPGAWTHYSYAIHDALEITGLPAVEVHLSDIANRDDWRQTSVIRPLCFATVSGKGPEGYLEALELLKKELAG